MKLRHLLAVASIGTCFILPAFSQNVASPKAKPAVVAQQEKKAEAKKPTPRLPNNFGKLGLTPAQKDQIYTIQALHNGQIDALEEQIKQLKEKRDAEITAVLSPIQKEKLDTLQADAKKKKADKADGAKADKNGQEE